MKAIFTGTEQDLIECGFREKTFGFYGGGDYIPQKWYIYDFNYKHKAYRIQTNIIDFFSDEKFTRLYLSKAGKSKQYKNCIDYYDCKNWKIFHKWLDKRKKKNDIPTIQDLIDKNLVRWGVEYGKVR